MTRATTAATPPTPATTAATTPTPERRAAPAPAERDALELTLAPVAPDDFLAEHWERRPLRVSRDEPGRFDRVLSRRDAEWLVCSAGARVPAFRLARDGVQIPLATYTEDIPWRPGRFSGLARVERVAEHYAQGATIILQALHLHWHPAAVYCRALEQRLGWPVQANAYLTPASAQGFAVHHDTHDVFVLQVSGHKRWTLYEPALELPLKNQRWSPERHSPGPPIEELTLQAGDTLFIPRGWPHEAAAADAESLHVTIGLHPPTRLDALRSALDVCAAEDIEFRRSLGADGVLPDRLLERLSAQLSPDRVAHAARRRLRDSRRPILDGQLVAVRAAAELSPDDRVQRRPTVIADVELRSTGAALIFEGKEILFPARASAAVQAAHDAEGPFAPGDLPGPLSVEERLVIVRRLVREGFLRPLEEAA
jgi:ribosomal protein L16 Arg81 hydroxylase